MFWDDCIDGPAGTRQPCVDAHENITTGTEMEGWCVLFAANFGKPLNVRLIAA